MKLAPLIGYLGCLLWLVSLLIRDKEYEVTQVVVGLIAVLLLVAATITVGAQKQRVWLGVALSPLNIIFCLGFLIVMLVPKKELHHAA
ncbi:MAG: hypothetical protein ABI042_16270 [Verrucomicrobiota bacterium]